MVMLFTKYKLDAMYRELYVRGSVTNSFSGTPLTAFMEATEALIRNIKLSPAKSCELDPLPTLPLQECIAELVPTITDIVNMLLRDSLIPKSLKTANHLTTLEENWFRFSAPYLI